MKHVRMIIAAAAFAAAAVASSGPAHAWGCAAVSQNGTYGYSYNYSNQNDAVNRALNECASRATTDQTCEITECDPNA